MSEETQTQLSQTPPMGSDVRAKAHLDGKQLFRLYVILTSSTVGLALVAGVGIIWLVLEGKMKLEFQDMLALALGLFAVFVTIVVSRLSTDVRRVGERVEILIASNEGHMKLLNTTIGNAAERTQTALAELQPKLEFEKMFRSLQTGVTPSGTGGESDTSPNKQGTPEGQPRLVKHAQSIRDCLSYDQVEVLRVFQTTGERVISSDFFERCMRKANLTESGIHRALNGLQQHNCIYVHATALALTQVGLEVASDIGSGNSAVHTVDSTEGERAGM